MDGLRPLSLAEKAGIFKYDQFTVVDPGALYEVVLTATVTAKLPERTVFLVEVAQAGLFHIRNLAPQDLEAGSRR